MNVEAPRRHALVTGAGRRVGRSIALELAANGFDVAIHYNHSQVEAEAVVAQAQQVGAEAFAVQGDLGAAEGCSAILDAVSSKWTRLDLLVNNASTFSSRPFADITLDNWEQMMALNLRAPFVLSQLSLPLLQQSDDAVVVHLCDIGAERPLSGFSHYSVSKAGLAMLVKAMAVELAPLVRTVGISPGQVQWPENYDANKRAALKARIPMKRVGEPEEIARLVRFVALEGSYLNGAIIPVDGGLGALYP